MQNFLDILKDLHDFHIGSEWRWSVIALQKLDVLLGHLKIPYFVDDIGNVILHCDSASALQQGLSQGSIHFILQAHLDHPGGQVIGKVNSRHSLYCARWHGKFFPGFLNTPLLVFDSAQDIFEEVHILHTVATPYETYLYFQSRHSFDIPHTVIHYHSPLLHNFLGNLSGWALDDLIGCAAIIHTLSGFHDQHAIGLLTMGEETGGYGAKFFCHTFLSKVRASLPNVINMDMPKALDEHFNIGNGAWLRTGDFSGGFSEPLIQQLTPLFLKNQIAVRTGQTEVMDFINAGAHAVSLAIPIQNSHNVNHRLELDSEVADMDDVQQLLDTLPAILALSYSPKNYQKSTFNIVASDPQDAQIAARLLPMIIEKLGEYPFCRTVEIVRVKSDHFSACNKDGKILISSEKIPKQDLERVICHELIHFVYQVFFGVLPLSSYDNLLVYEGVACYLSRELCGISSVQSLGITQTQFDFHEEHIPLLKQKFNLLREGQLIQVKNQPNGLRFDTETVDCPFRYSRENPLNKYGYYLGLKFIEFCLERGEPLNTLFLHPDKMEDLLITGFKTGEGLK